MKSTDIESQFSQNLQDESSWTDTEKKLIEDEKNKAPKFRVREYRKNPIPYLKQKEKYLGYMIKETKSLIAELEKIPFASEDVSSDILRNQHKLGVYEKDLENLKEKISKKETKDDKKENRSKKLEHFKKHSKVAKGAGVLKDIINLDVKSLYEKVRADEDKTLAWESKVDILKRNIKIKANKWNAYKVKNPNDKIVKDILADLNECLDLQNKINKERGLEKVNLKTIIADINSKPLNDIIAKKFGDNALKSADDIKDSSAPKEEKEVKDAKDGSVAEPVDNTVVAKVEKRVTNVEATVQDIEDHLTDPENNAVQTDKSGVAKAEKKPEAVKVDSQNVNDTINKLNSKLGIATEGDGDLSKAIKKDDVSSLVKNTKVISEKLTYIAKKLGPKQDTSIDRPGGQRLTKLNKRAKSKAKEKEDDGFGLGLSVTDLVPDLLARRRFNKHLLTTSRKTFLLSKGFRQSVKQISKMEARKACMKCKAGGTGGGFDGDKNDKDKKKTKGGWKKKLFGTAASLFGIDVAADAMDGPDATPEKKEQKVQPKKKRVLPKMGGKKASGLKNFAKGLGKGLGKLAGGATSWIAGLGVALGAVFVGMDMYAIAEVMTTIFGAEAEKRTSLIAKSAGALGSSQFSWIWGGSPEEDFVTYVIGSEQMTLKQFETALGYVELSPDQFDSVLAERMKKFGEKDPAVVKYGGESLKDFQKSKTRIRKTASGLRVKEKTTMVFKDKDNKAILDKITKNSSGSEIWNAMHEANVIHEDSDMGRNDVHIEDINHLKDYITVYLSKQQRSKLTKEINTKVENKDIMPKDGQKIIDLINQVTKEESAPLKTETKALTPNKDIDAAIADVSGSVVNEGTVKKSDTNAVLSAPVAKTTDIPKTQAQTVKEVKKQKQAKKELAKEVVKEAKKEGHPVFGDEFAKKDHKAILHAALNKNATHTKGQSLQDEFGSRGHDIDITQPKGHGVDITQPKGHNIDITQPKGHGVDITQPSGSNWEDNLALNRERTNEEKIALEKTSIEQSKLFMKDDPENKDFYLEEIKKAERRIKELEKPKKQVTAEASIKPKVNPIKQANKEKRKQKSGKSNVREKTNITIEYNGVKLEHVQRKENEEFSKLFNKQMSLKDPFSEEAEQIEEKLDNLVSQIQREQAKSKLNVTQPNVKTEEQVTPVNTVNTQGSNVTQNTEVASPVATPRVTENTNVKAQKAQQSASGSNLDSNNYLTAEETATLVNYAVQSNKVTEPMSGMGSTRKRKS